MNGIEESMLRLDCARLAEGDLWQARKIYEFVTGTEEAVTGGQVTIKPTYFVKHPDESFTVADPQP